MVADHLRAVAFLLADGVIPSNDGRGYVLRRLLRRAVRHGMRLGFEEPFLCRLLPVVDEAMAGAYPELAATRAASEATVRAEEEKFLTTIAIGAKMVQESIEEARRKGKSVLAGERVFKLYDTYGLPYQLMRRSPRRKNSPLMRKASGAHSMCRRPGPEGPSWNDSRSRTPRSEAFRGLSSLAITISRFRVPRFCVAS